MEAAGDSPAVSMHRVSVAAGNLCTDRRRVDSEYDLETADRKFLEHGDCADRVAGISVLEMERPESLTERDLGGVLLGRVAVQLFFRHHRFACGFFSRSGGRNEHWPHGPRDWREALKSDGGRDVVVDGFHAAAMKIGLMP